ncbi:MAG: LexA family transcriptional regulator [Bacteroidetes bacterium]|nr:LexA family transcriptional regulator [Bacteroidota bacterium]
MFSSNIKLLRTRKGRTQDVVANELGVSRSTLNSYENGSIKNPTLEALVQFSRYYKVSIDTLIKVNMEDLSESQLGELERGHDVYITGSRLRVLATTVDKNNRENIELVNHKAKAGYKAGYSDPDYIKRLPTFQLPILFSERKYRMFQISGDSMLPIPDKSYVIAEYVENWYDIKDGNAYVLLTLDEGIVFKVVHNQIKKKKNLLLQSLNSFYKPYAIEINEVKEVWKFCNYISSELPTPVRERDELFDKIMQLENTLKAKLK